MKPEKFLPLSMPRIDNIAIKEYLILEAEFRV